MLLTHQGSLVNASDQAVAELALAGSLIELLDDDGLASGVAASKDDDDLSGLDAAREGGKEGAEGGQRVWCANGCR